MNRIKSVNLASYIPPFISRIDGISRYIKMDEPEFRIIWDMCQRVLLNMNPKTADEEGIYAWETMLGINHEGSLDIRRQRVVLRMARDHRYTINYLRELLDTFVGEGNYVLDESKLYDQFILNISLTLPIPSSIYEVSQIVSHEGLIPSHIQVGFIISEETVTTNTTIYSFYYGYWENDNDLTDLDDQADLINVYTVS